jgi:hypothetical protein
MNHLKSIFSISLILITTLNYAQFTDVINSNRPGESMSAFSVGKTVFQAELGFYGVQEEHALSNYNIKGLGGDLTLRYGAFLEQLELIVDLQYQNDTYKTDWTNTKRSGLKQSNFGLKYLLYDPNKNYEEKVNVFSWKASQKFSYRSLIPAVGLFVGANLNFSDNQFSFPTDPKISPKAMLITQNQFGKYVVVTNIIADKIMTDFPSYGYVVTLTRGFTPRWTGFIENQGYQSDFYADCIFRGGAAYLIQENIQVDASFGANIKNTPSLLVAGIGLSWRFDENYSEIMSRTPKSKKDKKDKKGKDKKDKKDSSSKKRKDEVPAVK